MFFSKLTFGSLAPFTSGHLQYIDVWKTSAGLRNPPRLEQVMYMRESYMKIQGGLYFNGRQSQDLLSHDKCAGEDGARTNGVETAEETTVKTKGLESSNYD